MTKTCITCCNAASYLGLATECHRKTIFSPVEGERIKRMDAGFQRNRFWHWLGLDTCGPDGRYWQKAAPLQPPCTPRPLRPQR